MIFDTHCHLNSEDLYKDIDNILLKAKEAGVTKILVPGWDKESSLLAIKIANSYDGVYAAIGFHPTEVYELTEEDFLLVMKNINDPKVVAVGEIGLDYHWCDDLNLREKQKEWFIRQIEFANQNNKPIIIHNRDAFEDTLNILKEHKPLHSGTMHCYSGSVELLRDVINLGLYIGLDGPVTYKNAKTPKNVAKFVDIDKLLLETDAPYLAPHPLRGTINVPANLYLIADEISNQKEVLTDRIIDATYNNACRLFGIKDD